MEGSDGRRIGWPGMGTGLHGRNKFTNLVVLVWCSLEQQWASWMNSGTTVLLQSWCCCGYSTSQRLCCSRGSCRGRSSSSSSRGGGGKGINWSSNSRKGSSRKDGRIVLFALPVSAVAFFSVLSNLSDSTTKESVMRNDNLFLFAISNVNLFLIFMKTISRISLMVSTSF